MTEGGKELASDAQSVVDDVLRGLPIDQLDSDNLAHFHRELLNLGGRRA